MCVDTEWASQYCCRVAVAACYNELQYVVAGKAIWTWVDGNKALFLQPTAEEAAFVAQILAVPHFQALVGTRQLLKGSPVADPLVIASARERGGCVVTEEAHKPHAAKIPNVCEHFGIHCTNVEGFLQQNGWEF